MGRGEHRPPALLVAGDGRVIYGLLVGEPTAADAASVPGAGLTRLVAQAGRSRGGQPVPSAAVLDGPAGLFAAAVSPIVPQDSAALAVPAGQHATPVVGKRLDDGHLAGPQEDFGLDTSRALPAGDRAGAAAASASAALLGPEGEVVRTIAWGSRRPGQRQLAWLVPALLASLDVLAPFTRLVLRAIGRSTAAIRASEARFRDIAEAGSDWIWETDADLRLTYVSDHFARATGLRPGGVTGLGLHEVLRPPPEPERRRPHPVALETARPFRDAGETPAARAAPPRAPAPARPCLPAAPAARGEAPASGARPGRHPGRVRPPPVCASRPRSPACRSAAPTAGGASGITTGSERSRGVLVQVQATSCVRWPR
jgi:PAS domain-containing protein